MDKISGILPATARVTTVDLRNSGVARAGTPSFGREVGVSSALARRELPDVSEKANSIQGDLMKMRASKVDPRAEIVKRMASDFFINKAKQYEVEKEALRVEEPLPSDVPELGAVSNSEVDVDDVESYEEEASPTAQHLDVMA